MQQQADAATSGAPLGSVRAQRIQVRHAVDLLRHVVCSLEKNARGVNAEHAAVHGQCYARHIAAATAVDAAPAVRPNKACAQAPPLRTQPAGRRTYHASGGGREPRWAPPAPAAARSRCSWGPRCPPRAPTCGAGATRHAPSNQARGGAASARRSCRSRGREISCPPACSRLWPRLARALNGEPSLG